MDGANDTWQDEYFQLLAQFILYLPVKIPEFLIQQSINSFARKTLNHAFEEIQILQVNSIGKIFTNIFIGITKLNSTR